MNIFITNLPYRIDHYGEMEKTFQRADLGEYGMMLKVVPMTDENVVNQINCFRVDGTEDSPVKTQSILPGKSIIFHSKVKNC